jgi:hypothetical protein
MKRLFAAVTACLLVGAVSGFSQCAVDPFDAILCVYALDATTEGQFSATDGAISDFFSDANWSGKDEIELIPPDDCYPGRCNFTGGESDAKLVIRAAASGKAVYIYAAVQDNVWVDWPGGTSYGEDSVDLYFDAMTADEIWNCTDCLVGLYSSKLTFTTQQFQVFMGGTVPAAEFKLQYYDDALWSWTGVALTWDNAKVIYGFETEIVEIDATHKTQEWKFPWNFFGKGIPIGTPLSNKLFAFSGGYNDMDGDSPDPDCVRWMEKDPWDGTVQNWGDMQMDASLTTVEEWAGTDDPYVGTARVAPTATVKSTRFFTLKGEEISASSVRTLPAHSIVVKRHVMSDGTSRSEMTRIAR